MMGITLVEVVISMAIIGLMLGGIVNGYILSAQRAEWSGYSFAAQSLASQGVEQARSTKWDPLAYPPIDEMLPGIYVRWDTLDVPISMVAVMATNYVTITQVSTSPALRQIRADTVWRLMGRGPFTNTTVTFRSPDQ